MGILPCPFCGGDAKLKPTNIWGEKAVKIECARCHITTAPVIEGTYMRYGGGKENISFTMDEAKTEAIRIWNNRVRDQFMDNLIQNPGYKVLMRRIKLEALYLRCGCVRADH